MFKKGQSGNPAGKPKGTISKKRRVLNLYDEMTKRAPNFNLLDEFMKVYNEGDLKVKLDVLKTLAPHIAPTLKSIDISQHEDASQEEMLKLIAEGLSGNERSD